MTTVLVVDDEEKLRKLLARIISLEGYAVLEAASLHDARGMLRRHPVDILLCDVKLPDGNGVDFTKEVKLDHPQVGVVLLTAYGNIPDGVRAVRNGAFDYLVKGDDNDRIIPLLSQVADALRAAPPQKTLAAPATSFDGVIGESLILRNAVALAKKVAPTGTTVLLTGETGTGKEVFAKAIHAASTRQSKPFVALNCSAFSKDLLESTLFGHKAGAFTGAAKNQRGLIEEAAGGTLFLDEIGELPGDLQPKLLRFLEDGSYYAVGDTKQRTADVRLVAATNRALDVEISAGAFRSDLYYRIASFVIELPALRERREDIPALAMHFLKHYAGQAGKPIAGISKPALQLLKEHPWNGNIRELKNVLERAVILEDTDTLGGESLPPGIGRGAVTGMDLASMERGHILKVVAATRGNKAEAARLLQIGIATLYRKLDEYGVK